MRRLRVDVSKNFSTAASSHEGEFVTSTTTEAPFSASASPSPVRVLTPEVGDAATTSCPCSRSFLTSFDPMSPVPPITTIFMIVLSGLTLAVTDGDALVGTQIQKRPGRSPSIMAATGLQSACSSPQFGPAERKYVHDFSSAVELLICTPLANLCQLLDGRPSRERRCADSRRCLQ